MAVAADCDFASGCCLMKASRASHIIQLNVGHLSKIARRILVIERTFVFSELYTGCSKGKINADAFIMSLFE